MPKPRQAVRSRWTDSHARAVLAAQTESGLSIKAFAVREGLDPQRLYTWKSRLKSAPALPTFVEVRRHSPEYVEIVLRSGRVLRVLESIDGSALRRFVVALEQESPC